MGKKHPVEFGQQLLVENKRKRDFMKISYPICHETQKDKFTP